jgi:hypothetical protein
LAGETAVLASRKNICCGRIVGQYYSVLLAEDAGLNLSRARNPGSFGIGCGWVGLRADKAEQDPAAIRRTITADSR